MSLAEAAFETIFPYVKDDIPAASLRDLVASSFTFLAPLIPVCGGPEGQPLALELFQGPTAAFKDFGARFMARSFSWLRRGEDRELRILVATSGDTGGAVADGFFGVEGISVTVLYPKGRVSELQEKQIAGLGGNISALAVEGSFDDCQGLVKAAFADADLRSRLELSSANSINISRLIPQAVYYAAAAGRFAAGIMDEDGEATPRFAKQTSRLETPALLGGASLLSKRQQGDRIVFCVPSGNFGNLTAGLYARAMGAPIAGFIAATNINKTVPDYLASGEYQTRLSQATISNAMDVGAPSNFERMAAHWSWDEMKKMIRGAYVTDDETRAAIKTVFEKYGYYLDPHGAVGWTAVQKIAARENVSPAGAAVLATAHPAKFAAVVEPLTGPVPAPKAITRAMKRTADSKTIPVKLEAVKEFLLS
jgi:threonine synthase